MKLYNGSGQKILIKELSYNGSAENEPVKLPAGISKGIHKLEIKYPGGKQLLQQVFID